ncbi:phosphotransferase enzyme family protein, partial [Frankia sp. CpI1-P]
MTNATPGPAANEPIGIETAGSRSDLGVESSRLTLRAVCRRVGLSDEDATLIRLGENALYRLSVVPVVVRIARKGYWDDAVKEVRVAQWFAETNYPAVRLYDLPQPVEVAGHPVTFWYLIDGRDGTESEGDVAHLGFLLRRLHHLDAPATFRLPHENILGRVEGRIANAPTLAADREFLLDRCRRIRAELSDLVFPLPPGPTHGDAHVGNIMINGRGPILIDLERVAWGQPEWDLSMTATEYRTAGWWSDAEYASFVDAYG